MDRKFKQIYDIDDYEILSDDGWGDIYSIGQTIEYEIWHIETQSGYYLRCADDHILFDENGNEIFVKNCKPYETYILTENGLDIVTKVYTTNFKDNMYDVEVEDHRYYSNGILSHNTAFCAGYMLWYTIFNKGKTSGIVSNKESSAKEVLYRLSDMYESVPSWLKCGVENYAKTHISFENGSRIIASATSKNSFRGWTINGLLLADEFAHVPRNLQNQFWSSNYPTISASKKAKMIVISTPLGMHDLFHEIYTKAEKGENDFSHINIHWSEHPERDEKWLKEQEKSLGPVLYRQEVLCVGGDTNITVFNPETNKTEEIKISDLYERLEVTRGDNLKYKILTPNGFEDFDGIKKSYKKTMKLVFSNKSTIRVTKDHLFGKTRAIDIKVDDVLQSIHGNIEIIDIIYDDKIIDVYDPVNVENHIYYGNKVENHNCEFLGSTNTVVDPEKLKILMEQYKDSVHNDLQGKFRIYEKPLSGAQYVIGNDVSKGTGNHYSTTQVLRIDSSNPVSSEQVAVYEDNEIDPYRFAEIINRIAIYYNDAYIMVENNAEGNTIVSELHWNYENSGLVNSGNKINKLGIRATTKTKPSAVILMKKFIENDLIKLNDFETIKQLTDFIDKGNNRFKCENLNDDLVSALQWACYFFRMNILDEDVSFKKSDENEDDGWGLLADMGSGEDEDWSWLTM